MNPAICDAIAKRLVITFYYDGGMRTVEPYAYGVSSAGNDILRGYQVSGYSSSGRSIGWRIFDTDKITSLTVSENTFTGDRTGYRHRQDSAMTRTYCQIP